MKKPHILIVPKRSKFQWDLERLRLTPGKLLVRYRREGVDSGRIVASHERQRCALEKVCGFFPDAVIIPQEKMSASAAECADLILAVGGDNHFQFVSHFVRNTAMAGVNSDPVFSDGSLTGFSAETIGKVAGRMKDGRFRVEEWTRLAVKLNGKKLPGLCLSEVFLGESSRCEMSRYRIFFHGRSEVQKSSGLLAATGAGSSGWYAAVGSARSSRNSRWPKTARWFRFLATEPYHGRLVKPELVRGTVQKGGVLKIRSMNDAEGILTIDAQLQHPFPAGSEAVITLGTPLRVVSARD